jgi:NAD(P)-dependent dehydrogenase (short-subunit alcohol dehydrogenase family)
METKIALLTGGNKGIGFEVCRELGKIGFKTILTARDEKRGLTAINKLKAEKIDCEFVLLDTSDLKSIENAFSIISANYPKLDVLINNAAVSLYKSSDILDASIENITETIYTNSLGPLFIVKIFSPLLKSGSRVINVSSGAGSICNGIGSYSPVYSTSKTFLNAITCQLSFSLKGKNIPVNSVDPGWVRTDMGGMAASRSVEKGAETIVWLASEAPIDLTGKFLRDKKEIHW